MHVRHINYNDFLPLMPERDLNYRYSLWVRGGEEGEKIQGKREKGGGGEREWAAKRPDRTFSRDYRVYTNISGIRLASELSGHGSVLPPPSSSFRSFMSLDSSFAIHTLTRTHIVINIF